MSDFKLRTRSKREKIYDPFHMINYMEHNANQMNKESNALDTDRMQKMFFDTHEELKENDEADRIAVCNLKDLMPTRIEDSHNRLMHSKGKVEEFKRRNREWSGNQRIPYDIYHNMIAPRHRDYLRKETLKKKIEMPKTMLTHEDVQEERRHVLKGNKQLYFTPAPRDFDMYPQ